MVLKNFQIHLQKKIKDTKGELLNEFRATTARFEDSINIVFETSLTSAFVNTQGVWIKP